MTTTNPSSQPTYYPEQERAKIVSTLSQYTWDRCVTLTTKKPKDGPELFEYLIDFVRRIDGHSQRRCDYWFGVCQHLGQTVRPGGDFYIDLHVHGIIGNTGSMTNQEIMKCWRSIPVKWKDPTSDLELIRSFQIGYPKIVHFDQKPDWFWYVVNQTRKGEIFTNLKEFKV
jgi:hypothetical protein